MACVRACFHTRLNSLEQLARVRSRAYPGGIEAPAPLSGLGSSLPPVIATGRRRNSQPRDTSPSEVKRPRGPLHPSRSFRNAGITRTRSARRPSARVLCRKPSCKIWDPRTWVVFKPEEDYDEKEAAIEIEAGSIKASIPMARPFTKPISLSRKPSLLRSPSSSLALSLALSFQFPLYLQLSQSKELLLPVALSLTLSLSLLPLLAGSGPSAACAEGALEVSVGQANATIPLCMPVLTHLHHLHAIFPRALSFARHLSYHSPHLSVA